MQLISNRLISNTGRTAGFLPVLAVLALIPVLFLAGCASSPDEQSDISKWSAKKLYEEARDAMKAGDYETAIQNLETLEAKYPFGEYAEQAQLDTAYAYYKFEEFDSSIAAADRFIKIHPRHPNVDYAYYIRGLVSASKKDDAFSSIVQQDSSVRDPASSQKAYDYFAELISKFPNSRYAPDALLRMGHLKNTLAMYEINVANYYMDRSAYVAAINRAKYVVENYPTTPASRLAVKILVDGYEKLGMTELAKDARRVMELNPLPVSGNRKENQEPENGS
ncbi:outer membrane protein assembly factor BamD [Kaarinaea lacus]